jgi:hypothetical protein
LSYTPKCRSAAFHMPFGVEQRKPSPGPRPSGRT